MISAAIMNGGCRSQTIKNMKSNRTMMNAHVTLLTLAGKKKKKRKRRIRKENRKKKEKVPSECLRYTGKRRTENNQLNSQVGKQKVQDYYIDI